MAFLIQSSGLVTTGSTNAELFEVQSPGANQATILGLAGNDTISITAGAATAQKVSFDAGGDKDKISLSAGTYGGGLMKAGAGADAFTSQSTIFSATSLLGGDGNDTITYDLGSISKSNINAGAGADLVTITASTGLSGTTFGLGAGNDTLNITLGAGDGGIQSANIFGGGGNDLILITGVIDHTKGTLINGDSTVDGGGNDTITFDGGQFSGVTVKGKGGKDVITTVDGGDMSDSARIEGNAGADVITISGMTSTGNFIGGGSGNDTITLGGSIAVASAGKLLGGGGADSIVISALAINTQAFVTVLGGAGADTIDIKHAAVDAGTGHFAFDALSESNLSTMDLVLSAMTGVEFSISGVSNATLTKGVLVDVGSATINTATIIDGVLTANDFKTAEGVTARTEFIDSKATPAGSTVLFEASSKSFLFIQGGTAGTADDLVVGLDDYDLGAAVITVASASVTLGA
jgi:hypothetical protein